MGGEEEPETEARLGFHQKTQHNIGEKYFFEIPT